MRNNTLVEKQYCIYIATNKSDTLYTGFTSGLPGRMWQHKQKVIVGFTSKYNINKLLYYEVFEDPYNAIAREKQIKGWTRKKKMDLIKSKNPQFKDLSDQL